MSSGGGGGGGGMPQSPNVPSAGPARPVGSYPQYNPLQYLGMTPGANPGVPGMSSPISSYMPSVNGMNGFGGIPAAQLIQALMAGYAGVPSPTQTGAAPGMTTMTPTAGGTGTGVPTNDRGNPFGNRRRGGNVGPANGPPAMADDAVAGDAYVPGYWWQSENSGDAGSNSGQSDNGMGMAGAGTDGSSGNEGGGMYARGGKVKALSGPNPPGPDDGYAALDRGEYVVRASQAKKHGKTLRAINAGKFGNKSV